MLIHRSWGELFYIIDCISLNLKGRVARETIFCVKILWTRQIFFYSGIRPSSINFLVLQIFSKIPEGFNPYPGPSQELGHFCQLSETNPSASPLRSAMDVGDHMNVGPLSVVLSVLTEHTITRSDLGTKISATLICVIAAGNVKKQFCPEQFWPDSEISQSAATILHDPLYQGSAHTETLFISYAVRWATTNRDSATAELKVSVSHAPATRPAYHYPGQFISLALHLMEEACFG